MALRGEPICALLDVNRRQSGAILKICACLELLEAKAISPSAEAITVERMSGQAIDIADRLAAVRARMEAAAKRAGREASEVALIAVTKGKPVAAIEAALDAGQIDFGENYAQELEQKAHELAGDARPRFHFIGRLQRNKVGKVLAHARTVHAVDRLELVRELGKRAPTQAGLVRVLIEVNVGGEASKGGCAPDALAALLDAVAGEPALELAGLMTLPPDVDEPEQARRFFAELRRLRDAHGGRARLQHLSMGMSHDFEIAIEEGATLVRVGSAIFGAR